MRCYLVRGSHVTVLAETPTAPIEGVELVHSIKHLDQNRFPLPRLIEIWNGLPGAEPLKRFRDRAGGVKRVWAALEKQRITTAKTDSKQAHVVALLQRPNGATLEQLMEATGWQRHSVRGVLSGVVRGKLGLKLDTATVQGARVYRIEA